MKTANRKNKPKNIIKQRLKALFLFFCQFINPKNKRFIYLLTGSVILWINWQTPPLEKAIASPFPASREKISCELLTIVDGDTVIANCAGRTLSIRLLGIDAPEHQQVPWGEQAKNLLEKSLPSHFLLRPAGADYYHRQLGTLYHREIDLNLQMIQRGMAVAYLGKDTPDVYKRAEQLAKSQKIGIWREKGEQQNPKKWRREHPHENTTKTP